MHIGVCSSAPVCWSGPLYTIIVVNSVSEHSHLISQCILSAPGSKGWGCGSVMLNEDMGISGNHFGVWIKFGDFDFRRRAQRGGPR